MIPTSIDGTDITAATIDGTDVQEITVDGDVVFSAGPTLPVAYSNLIAWWPFDSAQYGGSNIDDVTAIIGSSGDDTAYNQTNIGPASYQTSSGVFDINAGSNSGAFDFDGNNDGLLTPQISFSSHTKMLWVNVNSSTGHIFGAQDSPKTEYTQIILGNGFEYRLDDGNISADTILTTSAPQNQYVHLAITYDSASSSNNCEMFKDGVSVGTASKPSGLTFNSQQSTFKFPTQNKNFVTGLADDIRIYDTVLTSSQINQIYQNTQP